MLVSDVTVGGVSYGPGGAVSYAQDCVPRCWCCKRCLGMLMRLEDRFVNAVLIHVEAAISAVGA